MSDYLYEDHPELGYGLKVKGYANELGQEATLKISDCITAIAYYLSARKLDKEYKRTSFYKETSVFRKELHNFSLTVRKLEKEALAKEKALIEAEREKPDYRISSKAEEYWLREAEIIHSARQGVRDKEFEIRTEKLKNGLIQDLEEGFDINELEVRMCKAGKKAVEMERSRRLNREVIRRIERGHGLDTVIESATKFMNEIHAKVDEDPQVVLETGMPLVEGAIDGRVVY